MAETANAIFIGVLSGLLASALIWIARDRLWPLLRSRMHSSPDINNTVWDGYSSEPTEEMRPNSRMTIKQWGDVITAETQRETTNGVRRFRYKGRIHDHQLVLNWDEPGGGGASSGSMVMKLSANRQNLQGYSVYARIDGGDVFPEPRFYVLKRNA